MLDVSTKLIHFILDFNAVIINPSSLSQKTETMSAGHTSDHLPKYPLISTILPGWSTWNGHRWLQCPQFTQSSAFLSRLL